MSAYRKRRLFPRTLAEVVKDTTSPLMKQQEKFYTSLLRDWPTIIGAERAAYIKPQRVQFSRGEHQQEATLHLNVSAAKAPELAYMQEQIIEQLARYFGYKAIGRLVLHPVHDSVSGAAPPPVSPVPATASPTMPDNLPHDFRSIFERLQKHLGKK